MATETLFPNGTVSNAWDSGDHTDVDEGVSTPNDSDFIAIAGLDKEGFIIEFNLQDSAIEDADTVNTIIVNVRGQNNGGAGGDHLQINLRIGGTLRGATNTSLLSESGFANINGISNANWDADWTASELDGMQLSIASRQGGKAQALATEVSEAEVVIDYTAAASDVLMGQVQM